MVIIFINVYQIVVNVSSFCYIDFNWFLLLFFLRKSRCRIYSISKITFVLMKVLEISFCME